MGRSETPTPGNPLGAKGVGETGTIASTEAVVNAVVDALSPFGIRNMEMPMTPERVWRTIQDAQRHMATSAPATPAAPGPGGTVSYPHMGEEGVPSQEQPPAPAEEEPPKVKGLIDNL